MLHYQPPGLTVGNDLHGTAKSNTDTATGSFCHMRQQQVSVETGTVLGEWKNEVNGGVDERG